MTRASTLRRFAAWLLSRCQRFSPPDADDCGEAIFAELDFVEGDWRALAWAAGGAGVLMRQTLIHFLTGKSGSSLAGGDSAHFGSASRRGPMRKLTWGLVLASIAVFGVIALAPSFRQAMNVTTASWGLSVGRPPISAPALHRLAQRARDEHDANTLAFVALGLPPGAEREQTADEAVRLDSNLTWIYSVIALRFWPDKEDPQAAAWIAKVKAWDPSNAYPKLLAAQRMALADGLWWEKGKEQYGQDARWMAAMADAFAATKYDTYLASRLDLDRDVMARRHITDPMLPVYAISSHPLPNLFLIETYATLRLKTTNAEGQVEAAGTEKSGNAASSGAWEVARFGQMMYLQGQTDLERPIATRLQSEAYQRLLSLAEKAGDRNQQALFEYQIHSLSDRRHPLFDNGYWMGVYAWNAAAGQVAFVAMLIAMILLLAWVVQLVLISLTNLKEGYVVKCLRASGIAGGAVLLASSVALYVSYHPYADLFGKFAQGHGAEHASTLRAFWGFTEFPWEVQRIFAEGFGWLGLLILAACLLVIEVYRFLDSLHRAHQTL